MLELEYAIVTTFPGKANAYGFAVVLDENKNPTRQHIFFHANDFQAVDSTFGKVDWAYDNVKQGYRLPKVGDVIAFRRDNGSDGRAKASPWLFARDYNRALHERDSVKVIIQTDDEVVLWEGSHLPYNEDEPVITATGYFPSRLPDGFRVHGYLHESKWGGDETITYLMEDWEEVWQVLRAAATTAKYPPK